MPSGGVCLAGGGVMQGWLFSVCAGSGWEELPRVRTHKAGWGGAVGLRVRFGMDSAVRSSSPLSPGATGRQGSASDGSGSMWAAVLFGVLTAFFAWLWFSSSGDEGDGTDSPKNQLQPVREEEEEETCEPSTAPLTAGTSREVGEPRTAPPARVPAPKREESRTAPPAREPAPEVEEPRTAPPEPALAEESRTAPQVRDPAPEREEPRTAPLTLETPRESESCTPGSPALQAEQGDGGAEGQEPGHPSTLRTKLWRERLQGDTAHPNPQSERSHLQQKKGVSSLQEPWASSTLQDQRVSDEGAMQEPRAALNLETKQESRECPLPLNVEPQQLHESVQEEETKANLTLAGEDLTLQGPPEAPLTLESEVIKSLGSKAATPLQSSHDCEELEPRASLTQASIQEAEEIHQLQTTALPVLESYLESEESKTLEATASPALTSKQGKEELKLQELHFPQTLETQQDEGGELQESRDPLPSTPIFKPNGEECSLQESTAPPSLEINLPLTLTINDVSQSHILRWSKACDTLESNGSIEGVVQEPEVSLTPSNTNSQDVILQESEEPLTPQSSEKRQDGILAGEDHILKDSEAPLTPEDGTLQESEAPLMPEDGTLQESEAPLMPEDGTLQESEAPLTPEDGTLQESEAPLTPEDGTLQESEAPLTPEDGTLQESEAPLTPEDGTLQESEAPLTPEDGTLQESEAPLTPQSSEKSQDDILAGEDNILKDSDAPLTPQGGTLQEPDTPHSSKKSLDGLLAGEDHILLHPEAPHTLECNVIKLLESKAPASLQSGQDCEKSKELEPRVSLIQASIQEAEEIRQPETKPLPVLESEERKAIEATDSHASIHGNEELKLPEFHSPQTLESEQDEKGKLRESRDPLASPQTFKNENEEFLQESTAPISLEFNEEDPDNILTESKVPVKPQSSKDSQDAVLKEPEAPLKPQTSEEVQYGVLNQPEALPMPQFNKASEHGILHEPETPLTLQSSEESQDGLLQEPKALDPKQDNQENTIQDVSFPESKQERPDDTILGDKAVKTLEPKQKIEGLEQLEVKVELQNEAKKSIAPPTLVSKQEKEGLGEQETRSPLTACQKDGDLTLQVNQAHQTLVSQQHGEVVNLKEFRGLPTPKSQVSEEGKAQEPTAPLTLVSLLKEEEIEVQEPRLIATLGSQQDGGETKLQESGAPISSLLPKQEHDQGIPQVPSPPLNLEPTEDARQSKPPVISTALTLESQQGNEDTRHPEAEVPQTVDKECPYLTHYVLEEEEQCNEWEMHPRGIAAERSTRGNEMFLAEEPEFVEDERPDEKQECDADPLFQNEHPESKNALWSSSPITPEKLGSDLNDVGEEMKRDATVDFPLVNGHRSLMNQCVASIAADLSGDILAQENKSAEISRNLTNVQVLEINVNESKDVQTNPMFNQIEDLSDLKLNINYESSGPELANVSEADFKPIEGETAREKKVAAIQPMPQLVNIVFKVHYITHKDSQQLAVIGDHEGLGGWEDCNLMTYDKDGFWTHSVLLPSDTNVEWKFVMVEDGKIKRWEECANRSFKTGHDDTNAHMWWGHH
uniref:Starch-binding domain-containing protein 1 n=1 Tax=Leptobrachium leishanense TaxID=445787 RepID=A0A8C5LXP4_9ANUR